MSCGGLRPGWFPAGRWTSFGDPPIYPNGIPVWHGSTIEGGRDASGYQYKRNRYYDPNSGRVHAGRSHRVKAAEAAAHYQPTKEYTALSDYEPFAVYAKEARTETLSELKRIDLAKAKRTVVYSFGAAEGLLLDRINPKWKDEYFRHLVSTDTFFEQ